MSKLGIIINRIHQGLTECFYLYKTDDWATKIRDTRDDLKTISCPEGEDKVVYMMTFDDLGCYFCIIRAISGRIGDQVAAWIFIPREINITKKELLEVIEGTTESILKSRIETELLAKLFSDEYENKEVSAEYLPSKGNNYAYRYYGKDRPYNLDELLDCIYQPKYSKFKAIFLIENYSGVTCNGEDLTAEELQKIVVLINPDENEDGFKPYYNEDRLFNSPKCVVLGSQLTIVWKKQGYRDVVKEITVNKDKQKVEPISKGDYVKIFSKKDFIVKDENGTAFSDYTIKINAYPLGPGGLAFKESDIQGAINIEVTVQGYEKYSEQHNLLYIPIAINLKRQRLFCQFMILGTNGRYIRTELYEIKGKLLNSPIKGYELEGKPENDGKNLVYYLRYKDSNGHRNDKQDVYTQNKDNKYSKGNDEGNNDGKQGGKMEAGNKKLFGIAPWLIVLLILSIVVGIIILIGRPKIFTKKEATVQTSSNVTIQSKTFDYAIAYLDNNDIWSRSEMEEYPHLKGLFDEMNTYNFQLINGRNLLRTKSIKFDQLCKTISNSKKEGSYCKEGDLSIIYETYIDTLQKEIDDRVAADKAVAIDYLDKQLIWNQDEMEKIQNLQGLFDALNKFNFDKIKGFSSKLNSSKLREITKIISTNNPTKTGTYNKSLDDKKITVVNYINALSPPSSKGVSVTEKLSRGTAGEQNKTYSR